MQHIVFKIPLTKTKIKAHLKSGRKVLVLLFLFFSFHKLLLAQKNGQPLIDSLLQELPRQKHDTGIINLQNALCLQHYLLGNTDSVSSYASKAMKLSEKNQYKKGIGDAWYSMGLLDNLKGNHNEALKKYFASLKIQEEIGNLTGMIDANMNIGSTYHNLGNETEAIKYELTALKLAEKIKDKYRIASCYINLGLIYNSQGNYDEAIKNYFASLKINQEIGDRNTEVANYINLGQTYYYLGKYPEALQSYDTVLRISKELNNKITLAYSYNGTGLIKEMQEEYPEALKNNFAALALQQETGQKYGLSISYQNLGSVYTKMGQPAEGKKWMQKAVALSRELNDKANLRDNYQLLMAADSSLGDFKAAFEDHKMYTLYKDSLFNEQNTRTLTQSAMQYEFDKKQLADSLKNNESRELAALKLKKQKTITYASVLVGILLLALSILIYFYYKQLANQKQKTERLRLSRDLHDDIGSTLSSMGMYSKIAIDKLSNHHSDEAFEVLNKMNTLSYKMADQMNDLVWNINPDNDTLQQTADRMKLIAARLLETQGIAYTFSSDGINENILLSLEQRKNLLLLFKEAINNIIKYAACKRVHITLQYKNSHVILNIHDDGVGFDVTQNLSDKPGGNGIKNMQARMKALGGNFALKSAIGKGTEITCSFAA